MAAPVYRFHTKPFAHQRRGFALARGLPAFAYLGEQGTGKTKNGIDEAADLFERDLIDALLIAAPNESDIPDNWVDQLGIHLTPRIKRTAVRAASGQNMKAEARKRLQLILDPRWPRLDAGLRVIAVNIEAIRSGSRMFTDLLRFCRQFRVLFIIDESTRIKSHSSAQAKAAIKLGKNCPYRRISTGTLSPNGPLDVFSQFYFLDPAILGFDSFTAYKAHYCKLLPPTHGLIRHTAAKMASRIRDPEKAKRFADQMQAVIQIPERDERGMIIYRNTEELAKKIAPFSFRVLKKDCLDLPPKLYATKRHVELTSQQRLIYDQVRREVIAEFVDKKLLQTMTIQLAITRLLRLQQIACNHYSPDPDPDVDELFGPEKMARIEGWRMNKKTGEVITNNPRMQALLGIIEEANDDARGIIWCRHHPEIREIVEILSAKFGAERVVQLHGKIKGDDRVAARKQFQDRSTKVRWLVGQVRSGIGIDLYEANWECFYSNDYSLENRLQAEDRAHRIGLKHSVTIYDLIARGTGDERTVDTLRAKKEISDAIVGDPITRWI